jgi:hypothetical protein
MKTEVRAKLEEAAELHYQDMRASEIVPHLPDDHLIKIAIQMAEGYIMDAIAEITCEGCNTTDAAKTLNYALEYLNAVQNA